MDVSILTLRSNRVRRRAEPRCSRPQCCFNPHPAIKQGAMVTEHTGKTVEIKFQSSPCDQTGCDGSIANNPTHRVPVSILTLRSNRVRQHVAVLVRVAEFVSILTLRSNRVRLAGMVMTLSEIWCFNPHPAIKQGATRVFGHRNDLLFVSILTLRSNRVRRDEPG